MVKTSFNAPKSNFKLMKITVSFPIILMTTYLLCSRICQTNLEGTSIFDFLGQGDVKSERDLEKALTIYITGIFVSIGESFAFVGRQYHYEVGGQDFFMDLLFIILSCTVMWSLSENGRF